jgi:hypothetical protein
VVAGVNAAVITGWNPAAGSVSPHGFPVYDRTEALIGSSILLVLGVIVLIVLALAWWRRR